MGNKCTCCAHRERASLDLALCRGVSVGALARKYSLSTDSIYRHQKAHISAAVRAKLVAGPDLAGVDIAKLRDDESDSILLNLINLRHRLFAAIDDAETFGDPSMLASLAGAIHKNLEIAGKLVGTLGIGHTVTNNVLIMPAWVETRGALMDALAAFPEARQSVAKALHAMEARAADAVRAETRSFAGVMPKTPMVIEHEPTLPACPVPMPPPC